MLRAVARVRALPTCRRTRNTVWCRTVSGGRPPARAQGLHPDGILARELGIIGTPAKFAISPDLRVVQVWLGMTTRQSHPAELGSLLSMYGIEPTSLPGSAGEGGRIFTRAHLE